MERTTVYFDKPGQENTGRTLELAAGRARELGIKTVIVASTEGNTAVKAVEAFKGLKVVAITHVSGFMVANTQEFTEENRKAVEAAGAIVHTAAHTFGGLQRSYATEGSYPAPGLAMGDVIAMALRTFGQGTKVALECGAMAADAGLVRTDEECISIGGSGRGADTALVIQPAPTHRFFNSRVKEIICKPRL